MGYISGKEIQRLNDTQIKILESLAEDKYLSAAKIAARIGVSGRTIEKNIQKLKELDILVDHGPPKSGYWEIINVAVCAQTKRKECQIGMKKVLIFSGTTEGRRLSEKLAKAGISVVACVATEYSSEVMESGRKEAKPLSGLPGSIAIHKGRMNQNEMQEFMGKENFIAVVDATHPFAREVSINIEKSANMQKIPYLRLKRNTAYNGSTAYNESAAYNGNTAYNGSTAYNGKCTERIKYFSENEECAKALLKTEGNILLTTGSKELKIYCGEKELRKRLYARVLPTEESISICKENGLSGGQIIAMQGPFMEKMNEALICQYNIKHMVTKESGSVGGFEEKVSVADKMGIGLFVISNPETKEGLSFAEVLKKLEIMTGVLINEPETLNISLIGIGMGSKDTLTIGAKKEIEAADYIFGAKRMLSLLNEWEIGKAAKKTYPFYTIDKIIPVLDDIILSRNENPGMNESNAAVLFSGDSGFYSGSGKVYQGLREWKMRQGVKAVIKIYPGISSVSYFAAALGTSWEDAKIISIHGKGEKKNWKSEVAAAVKYNAKVFILLSGADDVKAVGELLYENGLRDCRAVIGYQLSYKDEVIAEYAGECSQGSEYKHIGEYPQYGKAGLYIMAVFNKNCQKKILSPLRRDSEFIRGDVPMTKEEIRKLVVCRLALTDFSVVYDIGSGTGSVAVEIGERSEKIKVYAVEQKKEGIDLIHKNIEKFGLSNIEVIEGTAPECLKNLPIPTHAFIGGSNGKLKCILNALYEKNPEMKIVMTVVTLETMGEVSSILKDMPVEDEDMIQLQASRMKNTGNYHLMQAENPVFLCSFRFRKRI